MLNVECRMSNSDLLTYKIDTLIKQNLSLKVVQQLKVSLLIAEARYLGYVEESLGQLVLLGFDIAVFTPAAYLRRRLQRPSMEFSSCGWLRT